MTSTVRRDNVTTARAKSAGRGKTAALYRMAMPGHLCPVGIKSSSVLQRKGFDVDDNLLTTREEVDVFQEAQGVVTTPQTFIDGCTELKEHISYRIPGKGDTSYTPVIAIFASTALVAHGPRDRAGPRCGGGAVLTWLK